MQFSPQQFKFAVPSHLEFHGDSGYAKLFAQAILKLRQLGGTPVEIDFAPFVEAGALLYGPWVAERAAHLEPHMKDMLPVTREILEGAKKYSAVDFFKARNRLDELKRRAARPSSRPTSSWCRPRRPSTRWRRSRRSRSS